ITELPKIDTEISPKINEGTSISKTNNNILQEIPNITPHLAQLENYASSLIESNSQMRPSLEASPLPIGGIGAIPVMTSTLMSPLSAYIFLVLLIIAVMWFVVLRRTWNIGRLKEPLLRRTEGTTLKGYKKRDRIWDAWARKITMNINAISPATHALLVPEILKNIFSHLSKDEDLFKIITVNHIWRSEGFRAI
ncbi:7246_t:CDS:2, partial [Entrophospora sp. SA101]